MPIKPFSFPGVSLTQEFVASNVGSESVLSVACIGRPYYLHRADVESEAAVAEVNYKLTGTTATVLPNPTIEQKLDGTTAPATVDTAGTYVGVDGTTVYFNKLVVYDGEFDHASLTPTSGTSISASSTPVLLELGFGSNVMSGGGYKADAAFGTREAEVGDKVEILGANDKSLAIGTISAIKMSASATGYDTIDVAVAGATAGTATTVKFIVEEDGEFKNSSTATAVTITGTTSTTATFTPGDNLSKAIGGVASTLRAGKYSMAVQYREINSVYEGYLGQVWNAEDAEAILGGASLANPLGLAVQMATLAAPGTLVYFTSPKGTTSAKFKEALDFLDKYEEIYSIVPCTSEAATITTLLNDIIATSQDPESKVYRSLWYGLDVLYTAGADNEVKVANIISARKAITSSYKAQAIWADGATYGGEAIPNWALAAAAAGMRSYQPCHRPLSNLQYTFIKLKEPNGFTRSQLKRIAAEGIWIIANNQDDIAINMRQLTTAVANDINKDEESIIANVDDISLSLCRLGEDKVGSSNITPLMLMALTDAITWFMDQKTINQTGNDWIGPQLVSWSLDAIWQDQIQRDHVYARITCEPPKPFNKFVITLRVI
jgi:hypothetical protein